MHYLATDKKINFFYSFPNNDLPFSTPKDHQKNKPNFRSAKNTNFQAPHVSKPTKANPIQTQFKPKPNPILTQSKANFRDYIEISISFFRDAAFSLNSCTEQYSTGTTSIVSIFSVIGPKDGIAIRTMTSEPRPVEVRMGRNNSNPGRRPLRLCSGQAGLNVRRCGLR
ncbi:hypothetical protein LCGC14_2883740 [marine sediment metagenome]|uniref:Uncharacterized protein n=1 Tax=marine sediment metagenome TaxID=412755 RepID=A0A0F8YL56_9ZZZZ